MLLDLLGLVSNDWRQIILTDHLILYDKWCYFSVLDLRSPEIWVYCWKLAEASDQLRCSRDPEQLKISEPLLCALSLAEVLRRQEVSLGRLRRVALRLCLDIPSFLKSVATHTQAHVMSSRHHAVPCASRHLERIIRRALLSAFLDTCSWGKRFRLCPFEERFRNQIGGETHSRPYSPLKKHFISSYKMLYPRNCQENRPFHLFSFAHT